MHQRTDLASGAINGSDRLLIELIELAGQPPIVAISWPRRPTKSSPAHFDQVVANTMRLLRCASQIDGSRAAFSKVTPHLVIRYHGERWTAGESNSTGNHLTDPLANLLAALPLVEGQETCGCNAQFPGSSV
jgi:hypothetical protein